MKTYPNQPLSIQKYDPSYQQLFEIEKEKIHNKLEKYVFGIEHIGSTSVKGLGGKPVIDIMIGINSSAEADICIQLLSDLDYQYVDHGQQWYFRKNSGQSSGYHIHMIEKGNIFWDERLAFRNYLRSNPRVAEEYQNLKNDLFKKTGEDRRAYGKGKADFMVETLKKALEEYEK